jgi:hypothetical protein
MKRDTRVFLGAADATKPIEKVQMERAAAKLAVGYGLEADILLAAHDIANGIVFDRTQSGAVDFPILEILPRPKQLRRPQQTAHMVGAEWRCKCRHFVVPPFSSAREYTSTG